VIGAWSLVSRLALALFFLGFAYAATRDLRRAGSWVRSGPICLASGLCALGMVGQLLVNTALLIRVRSLSREEVESITVGAERVADKDAINELVACLSQATWFAGQRGRHQAFHLALQDGTTLVWEIGTLRDGAVLDFGREPLPIFQPYRGSAYVSCLPDQLAQHGVILR